MEKSQENPLVKWENHRKNLWGNGKIIGKTSGKMRKSWENPLVKWKIIGKP